MEKATCFTWLQNVSFKEPRSTFLGIHVHLMVSIFRFSSNRLGEDTDGTGAEGDPTTCLFGGAKKAPSEKEAHHHVSFDGKQLEPDPMRTANYMHEALKPRRVCTYIQIHCKDMQTSSDPRQLLKKAVCSQGTIPHKQPNGLSLSPPETHLQTHMSPKRAARRPKKLQRRRKVMGNWQSLREGQSPDGRILAESRPMPVQYRGLGQMQATQAIQSKRKGDLTLEHLSSSQRRCDVLACRHS